MKLRSEPWNATSYFEIILIAVAHKTHYSISFWSTFSKWQKIFADKLNFRKLFLYTPFALTTESTPLSSCSLGNIDFSYKVPLTVIYRFCRFCSRFHPREFRFLFYLWIEKFRNLLEIVDFLLQIYVIFVIFFRIKVAYMLLQIINYLSTFKFQTNRFSTSGVIE